MRIKILKKIVSLTLMTIMLTTLFIGGMSGYTYAADASTAIESSFASCKIGQTIDVANDGYIGIPVSVSVYFDKTNNMVTAGYGGTPVIIYVINTKVERIGTESDVSIISKMLDKGYIVTVLDYKENIKAKSPDLDWSVQNIALNIRDGVYFKDSTVFPGGSYYESFVVPAGYTVDLNNVFWEFDKHGADGAFDRIVEVWNNDFRGTKGNTIIKWVDENGNRKATQNAFDGSTPVWLNANGSTDSNGEYIKIKYTKAEKITDCVNKDGSPLDLNLYMHFIYPTNPTDKVPVMCLSNSSEHLASGAATKDRPQLNGFMFNGYAGVMYEYGYVPMARNDHYGYFDGNASSGHISGENTVYSLQYYDDKTINTAAMRYVRYMAGSDSAFNFDVDAIGVYGNSKGGWMTFLGEEHPEELAPSRCYVGHHGESRFEVGDTTDSGIIDGGEQQPWLTLDGKALASNANFVYASCGGADNYITVNHAPTYVAFNMQDGTAFATSSAFYNLCRIYDVPALGLDLNLGHTFAYGKDVKYGVDAYDALYDFAGYYLKKEPVQVVYTDPVNNSDKVACVSPVTVKFTGPVSDTEIEKVSINSSGGNALDGIWKSAYGKTEWTFYPMNVVGGETYTITVPADIKGDNGIAMGNAHISTFTAQKESIVKAEETGSDSSVITKTANGTYITFVVPDSTETDSNLSLLRFYVSNDAVNIAEVYEVSDFNVSSPDASTVGDKLGEVTVNGSGYYEVDITSYLAEIPSGTRITLLVKNQKAAATTKTYSAPLSAELGDCSLNTYVDHEFTNAPDGTSSLKITMGTNSKNGTSSYVNNEFYNALTVLSNSKLIKSSALDSSDYDRRFKISFKVYDTVSRNIQTYLTSCNKYSAQKIDKKWNIYNVVTTKDGWTDIEFEYDVYDSEFGSVGNQAKALSVLAETRGNADAPLYIRDLCVEEITTDIEIAQGDTSPAIAYVASDLATEYGNIPFEYSSVENFPYVLFSADGKFVGAYEKLSSNTNQEETAYGAARYAGNGCVILLRRDITNSDTTYSNLAHTTTSPVLDLGGHTLTANGMLFNMMEKSTAGTKNFVIKNGTLLAKDSALVSYSQLVSSSSTFNMEFENVTFGYASGATTLSPIFKYSEPTLGSFAANASFKDCTFDLMSNVPSGNITLLPVGSANGMIAGRISVYGSMIKSAEPSKLTVKTAYNSSSAISFASDDNGNYLGITVPNGATPSAETFTLSSGSLISFTLESESDTGDVYRLGIGSEGDTGLTTPYGIISQDYEDVEKYPIVLFDANQTCVGGYSTLGTTSGGGVLGSARWYDGCTIYLRRDLTDSSGRYLNIIYHKTNNIDLGGHTLTFTAGNSMFEVINKGTPATPKINISNGTIKLKSESLITFSESAPTATANIDFSFTDVTFALAEGASVTELMVTYPTYTFSKTITSAMNYENCTFDMTANMPSAGINLIASGDASASLLVDVKVTGGNVKAASAEGLTVKSIYNANSSAVFAKDADGKYMTMQLNSGAASPAESFNLDSGEIGKFVFDSSDNTYDYYSIGLADTIPTEYGEIPGEYASVDDYPFAVFKADGTFYGAYTKWSQSDGAGALPVARYAGDGCVILMRRNYAHGDISTYPNFSNAAHVQNLDLGGYTLTISSKSGGLFNANGKTHSDVTTMNIKNGSIVVNSETIAQLSSGNGKTFNFNFSNVNIGFALGAKPANLICINAESEASNYSANFSFDRCSLDFKTNAPSNMTACFDVGNSLGVAKNSFTLKDCTITAPSGDTVPLYSVNNENSSIVFDSSDGEKYLTLILDAEAAKPYEVFVTTAEGESPELALYETTSSAKTYYLTTKGALMTAYGEIPLKYESTSSYPFVIFDSTGNFIGAYDHWGGNTASGMLGSLRWYDDATIVLRTDYKMSNTNGRDNYPNLGHHEISSVIDLDGHNFDTSASNFVMFNFASRDNKSKPFGMTVKNGTIIVGKNPVVNFSYGGSAAQNYTVNYGFDDVTFKLASGASAANLFGYSTTSATNAKLNVTLNVEDCVYDLGANVPSTGLTLFNVGDAEGDTSAILNVIGGTIKADSYGNVKLASVNSDIASINFAAGSDGNLTATVPNGVDVTHEPVKSANKTYAFAEPAYADGFVTYTLTEADDFEMWLKKDAVEVYNITGACKLYLASYTGNQITSIEIIDVSEDAEITIPESLFAGEQIKAFLWGANGRPLSLAQWINN